ncbi:MAG: DUF4214 domain-containing protein [Verrucomicrobiaceae bacterium]|nr:MAG: DUF4214 domain-containing protein [Verrucomicrobiaceae bacterium]
MDHLKRRTSLLSLIIVVVLGLAWAAFALGPKPLNIYDTSWLWGDLSGVFLAWTQYGLDPSPTGLLTDRLSYPVDMSIALFDPMPIFLVAFSGISKLAPYQTQYFGIYFAVCTAAQGVFGYLAAREATLAGHPNEPTAGLWREVSWIGAGVCCAIAPITMLRFTGHTALASQWILILSIWVAIRWRASGDLKWGATHGSVMFLATGLNPYLALMVGLNFTLAAFLSQKGLPIWKPAARVAGLLFIALVGLYVFGFAAGAEGGTGGYGIYSMNALGPFDSNAEANILKLDVPDPTGGQTFEGYQYLGIGVIALAIVALVAAFRTRGAFRFLLPAASVIAASYLLSLSLSPSLAALHLETPLPSRLVDALSRFRCTGRFFWIGSFWIVIASIAIIAVRFQPRTAAAIISVLTLAQVVDVAGIASGVRRNVNTVQHLDPIYPSNPLLASRYKAVIVAPPWQCDNQNSPGGIRNYESVGYFAEQSGLATNNFYAGRTPQAQLAFHCDFANLAGLSKDENIFIVSEDIYARHSEFFAGMTCDRTQSSPVGVICFGSAGADLITGTSANAPGQHLAPRKSYADRLSSAVSYDSDRPVYDYFCENLQTEKTCSDQTLSTLRGRSLLTSPSFAELGYQFVLLEAEKGYQTGGSSNEAFAVAAYRVLLGRAPDQPGLRSHVARLEAGADRRDIVSASFMSSAEFRSKAPAYEDQQK